MNKFKDLYERYRLSSEFNRLPIILFKDVEDWTNWSITPTSAAEHYEAVSNKYYNNAIIIHVFVYNFFYLFFLAETQIRSTKPFATGEETVSM